MARIESGLDEETAPLRTTDPFLLEAPSQAPALTGYFASVLMTAAATVVAIGIDSGMSIPNVSLVFVIPVIIAGVSFGLGASVCSAILGALAYNFFLTEPRYTLEVSDPANVWAIALLFFVGLIVSSVAFTSRRRAINAALLTKQANLLRDYSRDIGAANDTKALVSTTSTTLKALFDVPAVVILMNGNDVVPVTSIDGAELLATDLEAARSALAMGSVARAGVYPAVASRFDFWPVTTTAGQSAVIGLAFAPDQRPLSSDMSVDIIARILGLALDNQHLRATRSAPQLG
jgi:two-component system sensor histidine kinase KdpD